MEVEHTSATRIFVSAKAKSEPPVTAESPPVSPPKEEQAPPAAPAERSSGKILFNPFEESSAPRFVEEGPAAPPGFDAGEKTEMFSPMDLLGAADRMQARNAEAETKATLQRPEDLAEVQNPRGDLPVFSKTSKDVPSPIPAEDLPEPVGGPTQLYSPMEAVEAGVESRRPLVAGTASPLAAAPPGLGLPPSAEQSAEGATTIIPTGLSSPQGPPLTEESVQETLEPAVVESPKELPLLGGGAFMPIPEQASSPQESEPEASMPAASGIDMGDDLLADPTRILVRPVSPTQHLVKEIKETIGHGKKAIDPELLLKKSERFIAKRNYYMARKILRHAQAVGADAFRVKERLREIRKLELPEGLYNAVSSDERGKEKSSEILDRLEKEFDLKSEDLGEGAEEFGEEIESQLESIFRETDPRTILDFGVALHEMGLFRQAESVFARMVDEYPETYFDAYYLAAISKYARKDYAGAVSILKKLSSDGGRSESEKIQIYYVLGELFEKMDRPDSSKEFFRKVAELDANYRNIRHKLED
jgi:hypothetical protein